MGKASVGSVMGPLELLGGIVAILTVPTIGSLSDYTTSRFGKRKGYIITGATFDLIFIGGLSLIAMAQPSDWDGQALGSTQTLILYALLFLGLQFSSNFAQGPYQGFVPDLVAEKQVGIASGLVGVMRTVGLVAGFAIMAAGARFEAWGLAFFSVGLLEFSLAVLTFRFVDDGPPGMPRQGRSMASIARETWDPGILRERSFVRMTLVRFFFLMGTGTFINISLLYLERVFGIEDRDERSMLWMAALGMALAGTIVAAVVGARISDRTGRKPVVWAAAAIAGTGIVILALAPVAAGRPGRCALPGGRLGCLPGRGLGPHDGDHPARGQRTLHGHRQHRQLHRRTHRPGHRRPHHGRLLPGRGCGDGAARRGRRRRHRPGARLDPPHRRPPTARPTSSEAIETP